VLNDLWLARASTTFPAPPRRYYTIPIKYAACRTSTHSTRQRRCALSWPPSRPLGHAGANRGVCSVQELMDVSAPRTHTHTHTLHTTHHTHTHHHGNTPTHAHTHTAHTPLHRTHTTLRTRCPPPHTHLHRTLHTHTAYTPRTRYVHLHHTHTHTATTRLPSCLACHQPTTAHTHCHTHPHLYTATHTTYRAAHTPRRTHAYGQRTTPPHHKPLPRTHCHTRLLLPAHYPRLPAACYHYRLPARAPHTLAGCKQVLGQDGRTHTAPANVALLRLLHATLLPFFHQLRALKHNYDLCRCATS